MMDRSLLTLCSCIHAQSGVGQLDLCHPTLEVPMLFGLVIASLPGAREEDTINTCDFWYHPKLNYSHNKRCSRLHWSLGHNHKLDIHIGCDENLFISLRHRLGEANCGKCQHEDGGFEHCDEPTGCNHEVVLVLDGCEDVLKFSDLTRRRPEDGYLYVSARILCIFQIPGDYIGFTPEREVSIRISVSQSYTNCQS